MLRGEGSDCQVVFLELCCVVIRRGCDLIPHYSESVYICFKQWRLVAASKQEVMRNTPLPVIPVEYS